MVLQRTLHVLYLSELVIARLLCNLTHSITAGRVIGLQQG
jgi:hypothetical protein